MVRKTKDEAELTRLRLIEAARRVFAEKGVSNTSLAAVAAAAGVTRGAIYWHFGSKAQLFDAMRDQVQLPLIDRIETDFLSEQHADPLQGIALYLENLIDTLESDPATRRTYEIMVSKCEYVDELAGVLDQQLQTCREVAAKLTRAYSRAAAKGQLRPGLTPATLALDTYSFLSGLVRLWLLDKGQTLVRAEARRMIACHIALRRAA